MPNIIWLGNPFFAEKLRRPGVELEYLDCQTGEYIGWDGIMSMGIQPDLLVVADKSLPPFVLGVEDFPCLTAFYAVDSHIHSWFPRYAQAFDICLVSLRDDLELFLRQRLAPEQVIWTPPFSIPEPVSPAEAEAHEKLWDLLFVGKVDPLVNPERLAWMEAFRALEPRLHVQAGKYRQLYSQARLILNHSIHGDLNFRVFEALACGLPLMTPRIGQGLEELFTDGQDLFLFDQDDIPATAALAGKLLQKPQLLQEAAWNGYTKVSQKHLAVHRADSLLALYSEWEGSGKAAELVSRRLQEAPSIRRDYLRLMYLLLAESMGGWPDLQKAYLAAAGKSD